MVGEDREGDEEDEDADNEDGDGDGDWRGDRGDHGDGLGAGEDAPGVSANKMRVWVSRAFYGSAPLAFRQKVCLKPTFLRTTMWKTTNLKVLVGCPLASKQHIFLSCMGGSGWGVDGLRTFFVPAIFV